MAAAVAAAAPGTATIQKVTAPVLATETAKMSAAAGSLGAADQKGCCLPEA